MKNLELLNKVNAKMEAGDYGALQRLLKSAYPADIADFIEGLDFNHFALVFRLLAKDQAAEVFAELEVESRQKLLEAFTDNEVREIIEKLRTDDAVDFLEELPASVVPRILKLATPETRQQLNQFLQYPENTAGSVMTPEFMLLKKEWTVSHALERIRKDGKECETVYTLYVTDANRILQGVVSISDLLFSRDDERIEVLMDTAYVSVEVHIDQEETIHFFRDYDLLSLPVVDSEGRLVGIITVDDVLDVSQEEVEEDFSKMALITPQDRPYLQESVWRHAKSRGVWLLLLMLSGFLNGIILEQYEHAFVALPALVTFIPMLTDTGGNAGSQSSTTVIRSMALGDLSFKDFWSVVWKELRISLLVGIVMAGVNLLRMFLMHDGNTLIGLTVSISLIVIVSLSKIIGGALPLLAKKLGLDPAIMAAPLITTIVDAVGLVIYFNVAISLLDF